MNQKIKDLLISSKKNQSEIKKQEQYSKDFTDSDMSNIKVYFPLKFAIDPRNVESVYISPIVANKCEYVEFILNDTEQTNIIEKFINNTDSIKKEKINILINSELANQDKHKFSFEVDKVESVDLPIIGNNADSFLFTVRFSVKSFTYENLLIVKEKPSVKKPKKESKTISKKEKTKSTEKE